MILSETLSESRPTDNSILDLLVVGGTPAGMSVAIEAARSGVRSVTLLSLDESLPNPHLVSPPFAVAKAGRVRRIRAHPEDPYLRVETDGDEVRTGVCVLDTTGRLIDAPLPCPVSPSIDSRVHTALDFEPRDQDVLIFGPGEAAAFATWKLSQVEANTVLALTGKVGDLSLVARQLLEQLEARQAATILWRAQPEEITDLGGYPLAVFDDRRLPDLQFDHVVYAAEGASSPDVDVVPDIGERLFVVARPTGTEAYSPTETWPAIHRTHFGTLPIVATRQPPEVDAGRVAELRATHYNATITSFDTAHNELWRIRVRPDHPEIVHRPGQYCTLGLGYWEPRSDDALDPQIESKRTKLIRRSYSISSPIFTPTGYLVDATEMDDMELYIVWVRAEDGRTPGLTPRLALKQAGDRIYLGPKVAGRYTLDPITDSGSPVVLCATGTGEAPHNAMVVELLRKGHHGPILNAVSVRYGSDLAYLDEHRRLESRYPNYHYLPMPTREPDIPKTYLQDLFTRGDMEEALGASLEPATSHFFLCGNPAMIGPPEWSEDGPKFPEPVGMCELLHEQGFQLDHRKTIGQVHFEEYW